MKNPIFNSIAQAFSKAGWNNSQAGANTALDHADDEVPGWSLDARQYFFDYMTLHPGHEFTAETVRRWAEANGLPKPPDRRAWGGVIRGLKRDKVIQFLGYGISPFPESHCAPKAVWIKA